MGIETAGAILLIGIIVKIAYDHEKDGDNTIDAFDEIERKIKGE